MKAELKDTDAALLALVNAVYYVQNDVTKKSMKKTLDNAMRRAELTLQSNRERSARGTRQS
jgi:hypothetical protein